MSPSASAWISLTDLGRIYGISAVHTGKLLTAAELRQSSGEPSPLAIEKGLAHPQHPGHHRQALWNPTGCAPYLERAGLAPQRQQNLISLWADFLDALQQGSPSVDASAEEMANDIPAELIQSVNQELRQRGSSFQVQTGFKRDVMPQLACAPAPTAA